MQRWERWLAVCLLVYPVLYFTGWLDRGLGHVLYAGNVPRGIVARARGAKTPAPRARPRGGPGAGRRMKSRIRMRPGRVPMAGPLLGDRRWVTRLRTRCASAAARA